MVVTVVAPGSMGSVLSAAAMAASFALSAVSSGLKVTAKARPFCSTSSFSWLFSMMVPLRPRAMASLSTASSVEVAFISAAVSSQSIVPWDTVMPMDSISACTEGKSFSRAAE